MHSFFVVLELQTANLKIADLETKIQKMEEEKREQDSSKFLFTITLYPISMD